MTIPNTHSAAFCVPGLLRRVNEIPTETVINTRPNEIQQKIVIACCEYFEVDYDEVVGRNRKRELSYPRQIATYLMYVHYHLTLVQIAAFFERDHTTVIYNKNHIQNLLGLKHEKSTKFDIDCIIERLKKYIWDGNQMVIAS